MEADKPKVVSLYLFPLFDDSVYLTARMQRPLKRLLERFP
jgi:hypothetical protein